MTNDSKEYIIKFSRKERKTAYETMLCIIPREVVARYEKIPAKTLLEIIERMPKEIKTLKASLEEQIEHIEEFIERSKFLH